MPKRSSKKRRVEASKLAVQTVQDSIGENWNPESGKNPAAVALGRKGGLKGGRARAEKLSKKRRQEIARLAAQARWEKEK